MSNVWTSVGYISRAHGLNGEVVLEPEFESDDLYTVDLVYYLGREGSNPVPVRVHQMKLVKKGNQHQFFLKFEHITDRSGAEQIRGYNLYLPTDTIDLSSDQFADLTGYSVVNSSGSMEGTIVDIIDNPAHPLLQVLGDNGTFYIPYVEEYVDEVDVQEQRVVVSGVEELKSING